MGISDRLKRTFNDNDEEDNGIMPQISTPSLGWGTRVKGFAICFVVGIVISIAGSIALFFPPDGLYAFAVLYSLGTLTSLASTMFLMGPCRQLKKMVDPIRLACTIILFVCIVLTIVFAVAVKIPALVILFCVIQFLALCWYSLSFIPFARDAVQKAVTSCC